MIKSILNGHLGNDRIYYDRVNGGHEIGDRNEAGENTWFCVHV